MSGLASNIVREKIELSPLKLEIISVAYEPVASKIALKNLNPFLSQVAHWSRCLSLVSVVLSG